MEQTTHDMSEYSDRLWKIAYERGKAEKSQEVMDILDIMLDEDMVARIREWIDHTDNKVVAESATTTDCISRKQAIEALGEEPDIAQDTDAEWAERDTWARHIRAIESLPPVTPTVSEDCISREWVLNLYKEWQPTMATNVYEFGEALKNAPSVTPKPVMTEEVREALMRLTMCAREECTICKYENDCGFDKQVEMATENMHIILNAFDTTPSVTPTERPGEMSEIKTGNGKGMFIPEVTVEMFRNAPLEAVEELLAEGEVYDIDLKEELHREKEQAYYKGYEDGRKILTERTGWIPVSDAPKDGRNVFLAHGTNDFKSCCVGHYDHSRGIWYEDKNFFATPIYDCKYWCDIPELPDMGDSQFDKGGDTE